MADYHEDLSDVANADLYYQSTVRLDELKKRLTSIGAHDLAHKVRIALSHLEEVAKKMES